MPDSVSSTTVRPRAKTVEDVIRHLLGIPAPTVIHNSARYVYTPERDPELADSTLNDLRSMSVVSAADASMAMRLVCRELLPERETDSLARHLLDQVENYLGRLRVDSECPFDDLAGHLEAMYRIGHSVDDVDDTTRGAIYATVRSAQAQLDAIKAVLHGPARNR